LSTPIPKALVAQMTCSSPATKASWMRFFSGAGMPAWKASAAQPSRLRRSAKVSVPLRVEA
jgi:hypothetical protein